MKTLLPSHRRRIVLSALAALALMGMIFAFSAQPADESSATSAEIVKLVMAAFFPDYSGLSPEEQLALLERCTHTVRKLAHFTEYAMLGFTLGLHAGAVDAVNRLRFGYAPPLALGVLYAASDELHQYFVPGRAAMLLDVGIDALGASCGLGFFLLCRRLCRRRRNNA